MQILQKNCRFEQALYKKCHYNIIYRTLNFNIPSPPLILRNYRILKVLVLRVCKIQLTILTGPELSKIKIAANNAKSYQKYL